VAREGEGGGEEVGVQSGSYKFYVIRFRSFMFVVNLSQEDGNGRLEGDDLSVDSGNYNTVQPWRHSTMIQATRSIVSYSEKTTNQSVASVTLEFMFDPSTAQPVLLGVIEMTVGGMLSEKEKEKEKENNPMQVGGGAQRKAKGVSRNSGPEVDLFPSKNDSLPMRKEKKPPKVSLATESSATRVTKATTKKKVRPTSASSANRRRAQTAPTNIVTGGLGDSDSGGGSPPRFRSSSSYMNGTANSLNSTTIHRGEYTSLVANHSKPKPRPGESHALLRCYYVRFLTLTR
jgi:hypothetical protein